MTQKVQAFATLLRLIAFHVKCAHAGFHLAAEGFCCFWVCDNWARISALGQLPLSPLVVVSAGSLHIDTVFAFMCLLMCRHVMHVVCVRAPSIYCLFVFTFLLRLCICTGSRSMLLVNYTWGFLCRHHDSSNVLNLHSRARHVCFKPRVIIRDRLSCSWNWFIWWLTFF